jgi:hypothetical protein
LFFEVLLIKLIINEILIVSIDVLNSQILYSKAIKMTKKSSKILEIIEISSEFSIPIPFQFH